MWLKSNEGTVYNLDFAYAVSMKAEKTFPKVYEVFAIFTVDAAIKYKAGAQTQTITFLRTENEQEAQQFMDELVSKLGAV